VRIVRSYPHTRFLAGWDTGAWSSSRSPGAVEQEGAVEVVHDGAARRLCAAGGGLGESCAAATLRERIRVAGAAFQADPGVAR